MSSSFSRDEIRVSNLRLSALFYLHALHPLGYHYLGRRNQRVCFGTDDDDSFAVVKAKSGERVGQGRITLQVARKRNVHEFYAAAISAGGRPQFRPGKLRRHDSSFGASVFDLDGNSVQVVEVEEDNRSDRGSSSAYMSASRSNVGDGAMSHISRTGKSSKRESAVSRSTKTSSRSSRAESTKHLQLQRTESISASTMSADDVLQFLRKSMKTGRGKHAVSSEQSIEVCPRALAGAFIGAAAGAAVAYAACKSEEDSARAEREASVAAMQLMQSRQSIYPRRSRAVSVTSRGIALPSDNIECTLAPVMLDPVMPPIHSSRTTVLSPSIHLSTSSARTRDEVALQKAAVQHKRLPWTTSSRSSHVTSEIRGRTPRQTSSRAASRGPSKVNHGSGVSYDRATMRRGHMEPKLDGYHSSLLGRDDDTIVPEDSVSNVGLYSSRPRPNVTSRYSMPIVPPSHGRYGKSRTGAYADQYSGRPGISSLPYRHRAYSSI